LIPQISMEDQNMGASEIVVGKWLSTKRREDFVIATKVRFTAGPSANDAGANRKHIMASIEESLKRLQTSYVDLYQIHGFDRDTPLEETLVALNDLIKSGKVRYIGVSNYRGYQLMQAHHVARQHNLQPYICLQPQYNLLCREVEWEVLEAAKVLGLGIIPWSPLKGGWLSGKYTKEMKEPPSGTRVELTTKMGFTETSWDHVANEHTWKVLDVVKEVATKLGKSQSQVSLRWVLQKEFITAPIVGPSNMEQANDNFAIFDWSIPAEDMKKLDSVSVPATPYPYGWESTSAFATL